MPDSSRRPDVVDREPMRHAVRMSPEKSGVADVAAYGRLAEPTDPHAQNINK